MGKGNKPPKNDKASMKPKKDTKPPSKATETVYQFPTRTGIAM